MKTILNVSFITLLLFSCNSSNINSVNTAPATKPIPSGKKILLSNIIPHFFSDSLKKDTFKLILTGDSITTSKAIFSIISHKGTQIYADTFDAEWLENVSPENGTPSVAQYETSIRYKVSRFFHDSNFVNALRIPEKGTCGDHGYPDSVNWFDIHSDKKVIGFHYWFDGAVDDNYLAWSKKQQKVVIYWYNND